MRLEIVLCLLALFGSIVAQPERTLSQRAERVINRIGGTGRRGSVSDRVGSVVGGIVKNIAVRNKATSQNTGRQSDAVIKRKIVNQQRRKMSTYAERKRNAMKLRKFSRSAKKGLRRIG